MPPHSCAQYPRRCFKRAARSANDIAGVVSMRWASISGASSRGVVVLALVGRGIGELGAGKGALYGASREGSCWRAIKRPTPRPPRRRGSPPIESSYLKRFIG